MKTTFSKRTKPALRYNVTKSSPASTTGPPSWASVIMLTFFILSLTSFLRVARSQNISPERILIVETVDIVVATQKPDDEVILRHLTVQQGDSFKPIELSTALDLNNRRLTQTNFFKEVEIYARPGSEKGKLAVVVEVKERGGPFFQFEGGHSDLNGWFFVPASLRFDNFFGKGNLIGLRWFLGDRVSKLALGYRNPNLFNQNTFLDLELFAGGQEFIHYLDRMRTKQQVSFGGLSLKIGRNSGLFKYLNFGLTSETYEPDEFIEFIDTDSTISSLPTDIADDIERSRIGTFSLILHADRRDNPIYPLKGFWGALSLEFANDEEGSKRRFAKVTLDSRFYQRIFDRQVLAIHLKGGYVEPNAPFYKRFYLGGANSLRGYRDRRLTPIGWGTKLLLTNIEFRFPLSRSNFPFHKASGVLFFDTGGIWQTGQKVNIDDLFLAGGLGFRVKLPVLGITRFDFSFPLNKVDNEDFQFHISLGHTF